MRRSTATDASPSAFGISPFIWGTVIVGLVILIERPPVPTDTRLWRELANAAHAPTFALITLAAFKLFGATAAFGGTFQRHRWTATLGLTAALAILTELGQVFGPRDADPYDIARNLVGMAAAGVFLWGRSTRNTATTGKRAVMTVLVALALPAVAAAPAVQCAAAWWQRSEAVPVLLSFEGGWSRWLLCTQEVEWKAVPPPDTWPGAPAEKVARVTFLAAEYPTLELCEPFPDWQGYERLVLALFNPNDTTASLTLRVNDRRHNQEYTDRFNATVALPPGPSTISFRLSDIKAAPSGRSMDLAAIASVALFAYRLEQPLTLYLAEIRLE